MCRCATHSVEYRPEIELHEHTLTVLYRKALREQVMPHLHHSPEQAGVQATVIEGGAGEPAASACHSALSALATTPPGLATCHVAWALCR